MTAERPAVDERLTLTELEDAWSLLPAEERADALKELPQAEAQDFFFGLPSHEQAEGACAPSSQRDQIRLLAPSSPSIREA